MTRSEAKNLGYVKYETGRACSKGHKSMRYTNSGACCECIKGYQKPYSRANILNAAMGYAKYEHARVHPEDFAAMDAYALSLSLERDARRAQELDADIARRAGEFVQDDLATRRMRRTKLSDERVWGA